MGSTKQSQTTYTSHSFAENVEEGFEIDSIYSHRTFGSNDFDTFQKEQKWLALAERIARKKIKITTKIRNGKAMDWIIRKT